MEERTRLQRHQSSTAPVSIFAPSSLAQRAPQSADVMRSPSGFPAIGHDFSRIPILPPEPGVENDQELLPQVESSEKIQRSTEGVARSSPMPMVGHHISQISVLPVQRKLTVGQPNDPYEQEADRIADQVMRMPEPNAGLMGERIDRKCEDCEEEELVQMKPIVQRSGSGDLQVDEDLESRLNSSKGGGSPLPDEVRSFMEPRFGADFSQVRVHTGSEAVQMNQAIGAQAFTHGNDIYFGTGKSPSNSALTAHELTHVVQQTNKLQMKPIVSNVIQTATEQNYTPASQEFNYTPGEDEAASIGQEALQTVGYEKIIETALETGFLRTIDGDESVAIQTKLQANQNIIFRQAQAATAGQVFTRYAVAAGVASQLDSPAPGPGDVIAIGLLIVGLAAAGYILMSSGGTPKSNTAQNKQFADAVREIEKRIGRKLSKDEIRRLHDAISGQDYGYHDIVAEGEGMFAN